MRKLASALILSLLLLVGCGTVDKNGPVDESKSTTDTAYLNVVKSHINEDNISDESLLELGKSACSNAKNGKSFFQTVDKIEASGLTGEDSAYIVGAAFAAYCPEEINIIPGV